MIKIALPFWNDLLWSLRRPSAMHRRLKCKIIFEWILRVKGRLDPISHHFFAQLIAHILFYFLKQNDPILFEPPYFDKKAADYDEKSISGLSKKEYLEFLEAFFVVLKQNAKKATRFAFFNADWPPARRAYASESGIFRTNQRQKNPAKEQSW